MFCLTSSLCVFGGSTPSYVSSEHPFYKTEQDARILKILSYKDFNQYTIKDNDDDETCYKKFVIARLLIRENAGKITANDRELIDNVIKANIVSARKRYPNSIPNMVIIEIFGFSTDNELSGIMRMLPFLQEKEQIPLISSVIWTNLLNISMNKNYYKELINELGEGDFDKGCSELENLKLYWSSLENIKYVLPYREEDIVLARTKMNNDNKLKAIASWRKLIKYAREREVNVVFDKKQIEYQERRFKLMQESEKKQEIEIVSLFEKGKQRLSILETPPVDMSKLKNAFNVLETYKDRLKDYQHIPNYEKLKEVYKDGIELIIIDAAFKMYLQDRYWDALKMISVVPGNDKDIRLVSLEFDCLAFMGRPVDDLIKVVDKGLAIEPDNADLKVKKIRLEDAKKIKFKEAKK